MSKSARINCSFTAFVQLCFHCILYAIKIEGLMHIYNNVVSLNLVKTVLVEIGSIFPLLSLWDPHS